jgi:hypothetical protein
VVLRLFHSRIGIWRGGAGCVMGARHVQLGKSVVYAASICARKLVLGG